MFRTVIWCDWVTHSTVSYRDMYVWVSVCFCLCVSLCCQAWGGHLWNLGCGDISVAANEFSTWRAYNEPSIFFFSFDLVRIKVELLRGRNIEHDYSIHSCPWKLCRFTWVSHLVREGCVVCLQTDIKELLSVFTIIMECFCLRQNETFKELLLSPGLVLSGWNLDVLLVHALGFSKCPLTIQEHAALGN